MFIQFSSLISFKVKFSKFSSFKSILLYFFSFKSGEQYEYMRKSNNFLFIFWLIFSSFTSNLSLIISRVRELSFGFFKLYIYDEV